MLRRNEKSSVSSPSRRPLSPPNNNHPKNALFKSKPENNYPLNNGCGGGGGKEKEAANAASRRISQSTSGLNCLMMSNGLDSSSSSGFAGESLSEWRSAPRLSDSNGANLAIRHVSCRTEEHLCREYCCSGKCQFQHREHQLQQQQHARRRRLAGQTGVAPTTLGRSKCKAVSPVYLRPEQNIPEVFAAASTGFKPIISEAAMKHRTSSPSKDDVAGAGEKTCKKGGGSQGLTLSRDDIVVTVRSAHV